MGLSSVHNSTLPSLTAWVDGSKITVHRQHESCVGGVGGLRGVIRGFSRASRRRLMRKLAELKRDVLPLFVTLTLPDQAHDWKPDDVKAAFKRFSMRFRRSFPKAAFVWRIEIMDRKSGMYVGEFFPHYHLLVYGLTFRELKNWLSVNWWDCCGRLSDDHLKAGTNIKEIDSPRRLNAYVSKYMVKVLDDNVWTGRYWGVVNVECLPWVRAITCMLTEDEAVRLIRYMRRYARIKGRDYASLTVLLDAGFWWDRLEDLLYPR